MSDETQDRGVLSDEDLHIPRPTWWQRLYSSEPRYGISIIAVVVLLAGWQLAVTWLRVSPLTLPSPLAIGEALWGYLGSSAAWIDIAATTFRALAGLIPAIVLGVLSGLLIASSSWVRAILRPIVAFTFPIPKIALFSLFLIWFGLGDAPVIVLTATGTFYVMLVNTMAGVETQSRTVLLAAKNLGAGHWELVWKVLLPGAAAVIMAAVRISWAIALILVVATELITSASGVGKFIYDSGVNLRVDNIFAGLVVIGLIGIVGYAVLGWIERRLLPWRVFQGIRA